ncbi:MAG: fumarylacetoacetate hydrolase family protein [Alcanivoracaceae bacterium]|nr:fumarylacetoacetate hydrolase family protein [Alcanivoracaceae bacterium]
MPTRRQIIKAIALATSLPSLTAISKESATVTDSKLSADARSNNTPKTQEKPMNIVRCVYQDEVRWGVLDEGQIRFLETRYVSTGDLIDAYRNSDLTTSDTVVDVAAVSLLSPVTSNQQFICQGANYRQHMIESGMDPDAKSYNMIFTKASSCLAPADTDVIKPQRVRFLDYEIELGLILRQAITTPTDVTNANLHEYVAGLVIVNDYSARDVQIPEMQFYKGKSFRTFGPVGPYLRLLKPEEMHYLNALQLTLTVNGDVRQQDSTANLVFKPAETLTELSGVQDLHAGDLIATGTPAGCALSIPSPLLQKLGALLPEAKKWQAFMKVQAGRDEYLKPGDQVVATIRSADGVVDLGRQTNRIVSG